MTMPLIIMVPERGLEPPCLATHASEACASTISPPRHAQNTESTVYYIL